MQSQAGWHEGTQLRRMGWLLHAYRLETKLRVLGCAVKANFNPNQPRVPAGNPDGGQWTDGGGGGGGDLVRIASRPGRGFSQVRLRNGRRVDATPGQAARLAAARARADSRINQVRELDPDWKPRPSLTETVEGEIRAAEAEAREAEARLGELSRMKIRPGPHASESLPARGPSRHFTQEERREINRIGAETGCHSCGARNPGTPSGNFVPDHQPPSALNSSQRPQRLYPHCLSCSQGQGGSTRSLRRSR
jgi:hypothetical protein